jgi:hypothetical protein
MDRDALAAGANGDKETPTSNGAVGDSSIPPMQKSTELNGNSDLLCVQGPEYCDNILSEYLCAVTTVFSQQDGIYGLNSSKAFLEISCRDLALFTLFSI